MRDRVERIGSIVAVCALAVLAMAYGRVVAADDGRFERERAPDAPEQLAQMDPLIGAWRITDQERQDDGSWAPGDGAEWHFYYILDGYGIQDDWIQPATDVDIPESERVRGTNIRIYDPKEERWEMAWIAKPGNSLQTFHAHYADGALIMESVSGTPQDRRITFYDMTGETFDWTMEIQRPDGSWLAVYRIHGERMD